MQFFTEPSKVVNVSAMVFKCDAFFMLRAFCGSLEAIRFILWMLVFFYILQA